MAKSKTTKAAPAKAAAGAAGGAGAGTNTTQPQHASGAAIVAAPTAGSAAPIATDGNTPPVGGGDRDGTNTTAAEKSDASAIVSAGAASAAPVSHDQGSAAPTVTEGGLPLTGDEPDDFTITHLQVSAKKDGFRRAGRAWPAHEVTVSIDDFSMVQIQALIAEPMLVVFPIAGAE